MQIIKTHTHTKSSFNRGDFIHTHVWHTAKLTWSRTIFPERII